MLAPLTTDSAGSTQHDGRHGDDEPGSMDHSPRALSEPSGRGHDQHVKEQAFIDEWGITVREGGESQGVPSCRLAWDPLDVCGAITASSLHVVRDGRQDDKLAHTLLQRRSKIKKLQGQVGTCDLSSSGGGRVVIDGLMHARSLLRPLTRDCHLHADSKRAART